MSETGPSILPVLVLIVTVAVAIFSIPDIPGVQSAITSKLKNDCDENHGVPAFRLNFENEPNCMVSNLIKELLEESYRYMFMANWFDHSDLALPGFSRMFKESSEREMGNAKYLMSYVNKRGGHVRFMNISIPAFSVHNLDKAVLKALAKSLRTQEALERSIRHLHVFASTNGDPHLKHVLEDRLLDQKIDVIKTLEDHITRINNMGATNKQLGIYLYDKQL